ncbi:MAG: phage tail sheath C-terminal domain-containing protein [Candidatus Nanopelagicaceae bacterium]
MASLISPGIVIKERDLTNAVVTNASAIVGAFASTFAKGPVGEIVTISSQKEFLDTFGKPNSSNAEDWFVASEFINYGGRLAVVRAETATNSANSGGNTALNVRGAADWEAGLGSGETWVAKNPGAWGNSLRVIVADRGPDQVITLSAAPASTPVAGGTVTFNLTAGGTATAEVVSYANQVLTVVLDNPAVLISTADNLEDGATDVAISSVADWWSTTSVGGVALSSIGPRPGTSQYASDRGLKYDEVHVAVVDSTGAISGTAGTVVERLLYLSKLTDGKGAENQAVYYKTAVNDGSAYLWAGATVAGSIAPNSSVAGDAWGQSSEDLTSGDLFTLAGATATNLADGEDDYAYTAGEIDAAYEVFSETEEAEIDFVLMGGSMANEIDTKAKAASVMAIAMNRKDCIAFVSPHKGNQVGAAGALTRSVQKTNTLNFFNSLSSTSYAVFDSGYKYMYDRFNDLYRWIPCNGDVAGLCVSTSATLEDWYSPAGTNRGGLRNAVKLAFNPTQSDRDELYQARVNPIVSFPGTGVILFGDKTALAAPSAFDRINVRRLFLAVQKRAERLAKGVLFEQNDATTRVGFASALNSYMSEVRSRRGVTDFLVVCDETNNTPSVIDRNEFVAEIYIKPTRSINYITVTLTATKTGVSFSEVIGG